MLAIIGPNGSGKTTLLRILASLQAPTTGDVRINGYSIFNAGDFHKTRGIISYVPTQDAGFYNFLTGLENLEFFAAIGGVNRIEFHHRLEAITKDLDLLNCTFDKLYAELSTGMKQILSLSRAFLMGSSVLLLDEPTRSLDSKTCEAFYGFIKKQCRDKIVLFSTHHSAEAKLLANKTLDLGSKEVVSLPLNHLPFESCDLHDKGHTCHAISGFSTSHTGTVIAESPITPGEIKL